MSANAAKDLTLKQANAPRRSFAWRAAYLAAAACVVLLDQTTKSWAWQRLRHGRDVTVINNILDFVYAENRGVAFGQFQEGGEFGRWLLVALACAACAAVFVYFFRTKRNDDRLLGACALLLAGIIGNLTDRLRLGHVVDFILVHYGEYQWPVFNIADAAICAGALLFAIDVFLDGRKSQVSSPKSQV
jgi:signal peptidase II